MQVDSSTKTITAHRLRCVRCGYTWTSVLGKLPKLCASCRQPWNKQARFRKASKEHNKPYISNRKLRDRENNFWPNMPFMYRHEKDEARRDEILKQMMALPANLRKRFPCFNHFYLSNPEYPEYQKSL